MVQATSGVASSIIGSGLGFAGGMKLGALAGTFIGGPIGTVIGGILGGILGIAGSMVLGGMAESASDRLTGVTKSEDEGAGDGSNVEPENKEQEVDMSNAVSKSYLKILSARREASSVVVNPLVVTNSFLPLSFSSKS